MRVGKKEREFRSRLLEWVSSPKRDFPWRHDIDPYRILVTEKLLQQTTYGHVMKVHELFFEEFPDIDTLAKAQTSDIEDVIKRLGFQRQRSRQLKEMGLMLLEVHKGVVPSNKDDLLKLPGIGDYVADAALCFAFNKDVPIVDMNVRRVVGRCLGWKKTSYKELERGLRKIIPRGAAKTFNWGIIDFSALICSRKPKCRLCFLSDLCSYFGETHAG